MKKGNELRDAAKIQIYTICGADIPRSSTAYWNHKILQHSVFYH